MLTQWPERPERALLLDTIAQIDPRARAEAVEAAEIYAALYLDAPTIAYAVAYRRLSGGSLLPSPPALPPLGEVVDDAPVDVDELLTRVEALSLDSAVALQAAEADRAQ